MISNDYNDALAIAEAVVRPDMRFVEVKTTAQQDLQALLRLREGCLKERTALCNRIRGLLAEYSLILPKGVSVPARTGCICLTKTGAQATQQRR